MQSSLLSNVDAGKAAQQRRHTRQSALVVAGLLVCVLVSVCAALSPYPAAVWPMSDEDALLNKLRNDLTDRARLAGLRNYHDLDVATLATAQAIQRHTSRSGVPPLRPQVPAQRSSFRVPRAFVRAAYSQSTSRAQVRSEVMLPTSEPLLEGVKASATSEPSLHSAKASLLRLSLLSGRGVWSRPSERAKAKALVEELERSTQATPKLRDGVWELVASDVEPFRASVFFLALAEAVEARLLSDASDGALTVHSLATGGGEVGRVAHVVEANGSRLHSLVELRSGSIPSLPVALTGTVISSGELDRAGTVKNDGSEADNLMFSLSLKNTSVQESKVKYGLPSEGGLKPGAEPNLLSWIGDQLVPSGDIFASVLDPLGGGQTAMLQLTYADDDFMVWRLPRLQNHFFCFLRGEPESWPAMDELRSREETAQQSLLGSAFALGMLNPFFSRRAGLRS